MFTKIFKKNKVIIGLSEKVLIIGKDKKKKVTARIDTGATMSSVDADLAATLTLGPIIGKTKVKSASGKGERPIIKCKIKIKNKEIEERFTVAERSHMRYPVLIGQNILKKGFLIDPKK